MKLYAQHGAQAGERWRKGIRRSLIDGVIYATRYISRESPEQIKKFQEQFPSSERLFDSQFYAAFFGEDSDARLVIC